MRVAIHPEFPKDVRKLEADYARISPPLGTRIRLEIDDAKDTIIRSPTSAGHFLNVGSVIVKELRRRNLHSFPFFILYGVAGDLLIIGAVVPSRSDPLTWLARFQEKS